MKFVLTILSICIIHSVSGQIPNYDSIAFTNNLSKYINRNFDSLRSDYSLSKIEERFGIKLNSLKSCVVIGTTGILNQEELKHFNTRIEDIAERFYKEGTPILISLGGSNSVSAINRLNERGNKYNLTYVSFGDYCVVDKREKDFERIFNNKTMKLLGVNNIE